MHKHNIKFPAIRFNFVCFLLILLLKIVDFKNKTSVQVALKLSILLAFQNLKEVN